MWKDGFPLDSRSKTVFRLERRLQKEIAKFGTDSAAKVMNDIKDFQKAWKAGATDDQLHTDFEFKPFREVHRPYRLFEIYAGPNRKNLGYRVVIMIFDQQQSACWVHAFKKQKQNDPDEVNLAIARADDYWNSLKGGR